MLKNMILFQIWQLVNNALTAVQLVIQINLINALVALMILIH